MSQCLNQAISTSNRKQSSHVYPKFHKILIWGSPQLITKLVRNMDLKFEEWLGSRELVLAVVLKL